MSTIDLGHLVSIKENSNPMKFNLGLEQDGRSKFPNCYDIIQPAIGKDGRWITGLDEHARKVLAIRDPQQKAETIEKIKAERESLEELTGLDLSGKSKFWEEFFVEINTKKPLDLTVPMDRIKYHIILASYDVAPNLKETTNADYFNAKYYVARKHEDVAEKISKKKKYGEAISTVLELIKTPDKAILIGKYLGLPVSNTTPQDNLFDIYQTSLEQDEKTGFIDKFNNALQKTQDELNIKLIFDEGVQYNVIRLRDGYYQRGNITYGKTISEAIAFLSNVKNNSELLSVQDEVENKRKFG